ncbi:hypothetical protein E6W36_15640 [Hankyongella ginsenosidimutans]|uniref:Uncharacterized protein n=1 Tax=Hankyongella ginsenosidimutans TaxID=1763828 RepID=A0A4D7BYK8_9SPHN|nr:hypothetical protein [Hankyongella ginsenosidimutans]QCI80429.1 hypothetical protein E6W36_15640 [Hankyongella ginsenosidimutans]
MRGFDNRAAGHELDCNQYLLFSRGLLDLLGRCGLLDHQGPRQHGGEACNDKRANQKNKTTRVHMETHLPRVNER